MGLRALRVRGGRSQRSAKVELASGRLLPRRPLWDMLVFSNVLICSCAMVFAVRGHARHGSLLFASGAASWHFHREREPYPSLAYRFDAGFAAVSLLSTLQFAPFVPALVQQVAAALIVGACVCKYILQRRWSYRGGHLLWHLHIAAGQLLVALAVEPVAG